MTKVTAASMSQSKISKTVALQERYESLYFVFSILFLKCYFHLPLVTRNVNNLNVYI